MLYVTCRRDSRHCPSCIVFLFQISIFMTHLSNYGNDRLALYMLESVVKFVRCWTNLKLFSLTPVELGLKYFEMYPQDKDPVWTVRSTSVCCVVTGWKCSLCFILVTEITVRFAQGSWHLRPGFRLLTGVCHVISKWY